MVPFQYGCTGIANRIPELIRQESRFNVCETKFKELLIRIKGMDKWFPVQSFTFLCIKKKLSSWYWGLYGSDSYCPLLEKIDVRSELSTSMASCGAALQMQRQKGSLWLAQIKQLDKILSKNSYDRSTRIFTKEKSFKSRKHERKNHWLYSNTRYSEHHVISTIESSQVKLPKY